MSKTIPYEHDIFLSYNKADEAWVERLATRLEQEEWQGDNLKVFFAPWDISPGESIPERVEEALPKSRKVCLIMTPEAMQSEWVKIERLVTHHISISQRRNRLIPLYLRTCDIPPFLEHVLSIDFRDDSRFEEAYQKLLAAIKDEPLPRGSRQAEAENTLLPSSIPRPPVIGFVARRDRNGQDILAQLIEGLSEQKKQMIALWGAGGVGKTTLALEAAQALTRVFGERIIWASAEGRAEFSLSTLLDEMAAALGYADLRKVTLEAKKEALRAITATAPALVILDNFETIAPDEQIACANYLAQQASCPVLITTRQRMNNARNIPIEAMSLSEAREFADKFVAQETHDPDVFSEQVRNHIIEAAERNPLVLQWVIAQIDLAQDPQDVLEELSEGEGDAAQRVFDRSFNLPQVGNRSRDALLALSLFAPSASRPALAHVAGLGKDVRRLNKVVQPLASLWLVRATEESQRLRVEGLTRELTRAHLFKDKRIAEFQRRFVTYFVLYVEQHSKSSLEDYDLLEAEKDNAFNAMDMAFEKKDWKRLIRIVYVIYEMLRVRGYWDEALIRSKQTLEAARSLQSEVDIAYSALDVALIYQDQGEYVEAHQLYNESLEIGKKLNNQKLIAGILQNLAGIAGSRGEYLEANRLYSESLEISKKLNDQISIAGSLYSLAIIAQNQGKYKEARRLYNESLETRKKLSEHSGIADTLLQLGSLADRQGEIEEAEIFYNESIAIYKGLGDQRGIAKTLHKLGYLRQNQGKYKEARHLYNESLEIHKKLGNQEGVSSCLHHLGLTAQAQKEYSEARRLYTEGLEIHKRIGTLHAVAASLHQLGTLSLIEGDFEEAESFLNQSLATLKRLEAKQDIAECIESMGKLRVAQNNHSEAEHLFAESLQMAEALSDQFRIASVKQSLGILKQTQGNNEEAQRLLNEALLIFDKLGSPEASKARQSLETLLDESKKI